LPKVERSGHVRCRGTVFCWIAGILARFPFGDSRGAFERVRTLDSPFQRPFGHPLGPDNPWRTSLPKEPLATSAVQNRTRLIPTIITIYTRERSSPAHAEPSTLALHARVPLFLYGRNNATHRCDATAPSIFWATRFVRWVVTHSLARADFHGQRPNVII